MKKALILHTSIGYGIKVTAESVAETLRQSGQYEVKVVDIQETERGLLVSFLKKIYLLLLEAAPGIWNFLYNSPLILALVLPFRKLIAGLKSNNTRNIIGEYRPDIIVSTQAACSGIVAYLKSRELYQGRLVIVFSDYHLHRFWLFAETDLYLCSIPEQVTKLKSLGISQEKIALTGMIIKQKFYQRVPKIEARKEFGLGNLPAVLVSAGSRGLLSARLVLQSLLTSTRPFQIAVVTGKNDNLKKELEKIPYPENHPLKIFGYLSNQDHLMSAVEIIISKPGGPTIAEAVAKGLVILLIRNNPGGHEEANLQYLVDTHIGQYLQSPQAATRAVENILKNPSVWSAQREQAFKKLLRPEGRVNVVEALEKLWDEAS